MAKNTSIGVKVSDEERKALEVFAQANDLSMSQVIRKALKEFLEKNKKS